MRSKVNVYKIGGEYEFRIPFNNNGMKPIQLRVKRGKELIWSTLKGQHDSTCLLPPHILLKNIIFGVIPKRSKNIIWMDEGKTLDSNLIQAFCFKGTSVSNIDYNKTYNPYNKFSKFQVNVLRHNERVQESLWRSVEKLKKTGGWNSISNIRTRIGEVRSTTSIKNMWKILTSNLHVSKFFVPNPAKSLSFVLPDYYNEKVLGDNMVLNFLFTDKINNNKQSLTKWVSESNSFSFQASADEHRLYESEMANERNGMYPAYENSF